VSRFFARKTLCKHGHSHASAAEAKRCNDLHLLQAAGHIVGLRYEPRFTFTVNGREVKMRNGQIMKFTPDFTYVQSGKQIVEEVKPKNGWMSRDVPVKIAFFQALWPEIELRIVK
jgi:hypothetical protein